MLSYLNKLYAQSNYLNKYKLCFNNNKPIN